MSSAAAQGGIEGVRELYLSLNPEEAYQRLRELAPQLLGAEIRGAYMADESRGFVLDKAFGVTAAPRTWHPTRDPLPSSLDGIIFRYKGRPLGAVVVDMAASVDTSAAQQSLEWHFAPVLFRTSWLNEAIDEVAQARDQVRFLLEMGGLLGRIDLEPLLINVLELLSDFLDVPIGAVVLQEGDEEPSLAVDWGLPMTVLEGIRTSSGTDLLRFAREHQEAHIFTDAELSVRAGARSPDRLLVMPLVSSTGYIGTIVLASGAPGTRLSEDLLHIVEPAVKLAATAIENARLFAIKLQHEKEQQQLALARRIQAGLLPSTPPEVDGVQLAATSVSANMIGGDYFDYFTLPDGSLGLAVADVAGKGIPAGLIMTAARAMFRTAALQHASPAAILDCVNRNLAEEEFSNRFVTAVFARLDLRSGACTVACAGHEPAMVRRADGAIERVGGPALPLGVMNDARYKDHQVHVAPGDVLVLFTDGVTEAMNGDRQQFGVERLETLLADGLQEAEAVRDQILADISDHVGSSPRHDDTTLIVASIVPPDGRGALLEAP